MSDPPVDVDQESVDHQLDLLRSLARLVDEDYVEPADLQSVTHMLARGILRLDRRISGGSALPTPWQEVGDTTVMNVRLTADDVEDILNALEAYFAAAVADAAELVGWTERWVDHTRSDVDRAERHRDDCKTEFERLRALLPSPTISI